MNNGASSILTDQTQHLVQSSQGPVNIILVEYQRWFDLDDVMKRPIGAQQNPAGFHVVDQHRCLGRGRFQGRPITHQLDTEKETTPADIADDRVNDFAKLAIHP